MNIYKIYMKDLGKKKSTIEIFLKKEILLENKHYIWRADKILLSDPWNIVKDRATAIRRGLDDPNIALIYAYLIEKKRTPIMYRSLPAIHLINRVEIKSFQLNGVEYLANDIVLEQNRRYKNTSKYN